MADKCAGFELKRIRNQTGHNPVSLRSEWITNTSTTTINVNSEGLNNWSAK